MKPIGTKVLVRHVHGEQKKSKSGLILPGIKTGLIGPFQTGQVIDVGKNADKDIKIHDYVLYEYGSCNNIDDKHAIIESQYVVAIRDYGTTTDIGIMNFYEKNKDNIPIGKDKVVDDFFNKLTKVN